MRLRFAPLLACACACVSAHDAAHQLVLGQDSIAAQPARPVRVAIIGAGAGGSSSAYFLDFLHRENAAFDTVATVYEASDYIGGRSTTVALPIEGEPDAYAEIGGSIFATAANLNMLHASKVFNLSLQPGHGGGSLEDRKIGSFQRASD